MAFKAFIFDLDGTLIDSKLDFFLIRKDLGIADGMPILEEISNWTPEKQLWAHHILDEHELRGVNQAELYPGVNTFLNSLQQRNIPAGLFTRNSRKAAELAVEKFAFDFSVVISRDDAPPKPDPTGLLHIARNFSLPHEQILYVGDYLYDLKAGLAAAIPTALFFPTTSGDQKPDFSTQGAHFLFSDFSELSNHY